MVTHILGGRNIECLGRDRPLDVLRCHWRVEKKRTNIGKAGSTNSIVMCGYSFSARSGLDIGLGPGETQITIGYSS